MKLVLLSGFSSTSEFRLRAKAWGREAITRRLSATRPIVEDNRLEYRRGALTEWYVNGTAGLEHGFTVSERPSGDGPVMVWMSVLGGVLSFVDKEGSDLYFAPRGGAPVLAYRGLVAWDVNYQSY